MVSSVKILHYRSVGVCCTSFACTKITSSLHNQSRWSARDKFEMQNEVLALHSFWGHHLFILATQASLISSFKATKRNPGWLMTGPVMWFQIVIFQSLIIEIKYIDSLKSLIINYKSHCTWLWLCFILFSVLVYGVWSPDYEKMSFFSKTISGSIFNSKRYTWYW